MRRVGSIFLWLGVVIGVVGVTALAAGFRPSLLPPALIDISVYKLTFIASGCVLAAGAILRRADLRRTRDLDRARAAGALDAGADVGQAAERRPRVAHGLER